MARILIVDDSPEIRRMLVSRLKGAHQIVAELSDGYAAASEVEASKPDIVIIDFQMPTVSGVHATREIKARFPDVVVIGYTSSDGSTHDNMLRAGADAVFGKDAIMALLDFVNAWS